jgi:hypothetical protein
MAVTFLNFLVVLGNDHEVEFHEIEIQLFQEVEFLIMRSKFNLFMRSNLSNNIDRGRSFFQKPFFRKFVLVPPQEVLGDEIRNEWYPPMS